MSPNWLVAIEAFSWHPWYTWYAWYTHMNRTLYIRDEDAPVWDRARELVGAKGISPVVVDGLRTYIAKKEAEAAEAKGFERITMKFNDAAMHHIPKAKAFHGRWIFPPTKPEMVSSEDGNTRWSYSVAITAKGAVVVFYVEEDSES